MIKLMGLGAVVAAAWTVAAMVTCTPADAGRPDTASAHVASVHNPAYRVSEDAARRIAWRSGIDHVEDLLLVDERWEVAGRDRGGNEVAVDIHAHDGRILRHLAPAGN